MLKWDDLSRRWAQKQWDANYLFAGEEDFLIEHALRQAQDHWLAAADRALSFDRFDAEEHDAGTILSALQTLPFLSPLRVIQVDHAADFKAEEQRLLAQGIEKAPPETRILWVWGRAWKGKDASSPLVQAIEKKGCTVVFWPLFPENARQWAIQRAKHYGKTLDGDAARLLLAEAGNGLRLLDQEIQKTAVYVGGRPTIESDDIHASLGYHAHSTPYAWVEFLRLKRVPEALKLMETLLNDGEEPIALMALLARSIRLWLVSLDPRESATAIAMRFFVKRGEESQWIRDLRRWTPEELASRIDDMARAEEQVKFGKETPKMALTALCLGFGAGERVNFFR